MRNAPASISAAFDGMRSDYAAAKQSRFRKRLTGYNPTGSSADYHIRSEADLMRMVEQSRAFDRDHLAIGQAVDRAVVNEVGSGFRLDPQTGDADVDDEISDRFAAWANDANACDDAGEMTFPQIERATSRAIKVDGDICHVGTSEGKLQSFEAHRLRTPSNTRRNVVHGVLLGDQRKRLEYWFTRDDIDPMRPVANVASIAPVPTRDKQGFRQVFHCHDAKRVSQTRGITAFAPVFDAAGMVDDISFAELVRRQVVACFAVFSEIEAGSAAPRPSVKGAQTAETQADGSVRTLEEIAPGMFIQGKPGEKLSGFTPNIPGPQFFDHMRFVMTFIGCAIGMPLVMVMMDSSETNYSGWRGAVDQARLGFQHNQRQLIERFHKPVYVWKLRQFAAESTRLMNAMREMGPKFFAHQWQPPTWSYIDPQKDAAGDLLRLRNGMVSPRALHAEHGRDVYQVIDHTVEDNTYAIRAAKEAAKSINEDFPDDANPVSWREVLMMPTPDGMQVTNNAVQAKPETDEPAAQPRNGGLKVA